MGNGEVGVLDWLGRKHIAGNAKRSSLETWHVVLQLELHRVVHDAIDVDESGAAPEHDEEWAVVMVEHSSLERWQQVFIFPDDVAVEDSVKYRKQCHFHVLVDSSQNDAVTMPSTTLTC